MNPRRRTTELGLLLIAGVIIVALYTLAALGTDAKMPTNLVPFLGVILGLLVVAHLATRRFAPRADPTLLPIAAVLNGIGYVFIVRLAPGVRNGGALPGLQAMWTFLGVGAYIATLIVVPRIRVLDRYRYTVALGGVLLLLLPLVPGLGATINGSRIWIRVGGMSFQPGEFAKIALAIFFASYLVDKRELLREATHRFGPLHVPDARHLAPLALAWGVSLLVLVRQKDLGSSLLFFAVFVVIIWVGTERTAYLLFGLVLFAFGAYGSYRAFGHVQERVDMWLDPWSDARGKGYQIVQASYAMADGGIIGTGPGLGRPGIIPEVHNDFIFAAIGEELGLLGTSGLLACYLMFIGAGLRTAVAATSSFAKLLATALSTMVGVQAFIIIAGVIRVLPLTGITLPFVSYGGSSLLANYVVLALLVRTSDETAEAAERAAADAAAHGGMGAGVPA
jgi:cell division protein FtsW (lipid II flippase)